MALIFKAALAMALTDAAVVHQRGILDRAIANINLEERLKTPKPTASLADTQNDDDTEQLEAPTPKMGTKQQRMAMLQRKAEKEAQQMIS